MNHFQQVLCTVAVHRHKHKEPWTKHPHFGYVIIGNNYYYYYNYPYNNNNYYYSKESPKSSKNSRSKKNLTTCFDMTSYELVDQLMFTNLPNILKMT